MFQGMDNPDDFIIVDDDDLIYMGKNGDDELIPMIIESGAEMLESSDVNTTSTEAGRAQDLCQFVQEG